MARLAAILWCLVCVALMALVALLASCRDGLSARRQPSESASAARPRSSTPPARPTSVAAGFTVVAGGLVNPRGLAFAADGALYVAEAGVGGPTEIDRGRAPTRPQPERVQSRRAEPGQAPGPARRRAGRDAIRAGVAGRRAVRDRRQPGPGDQDHAGWTGAPDP